MQTLPLMVAAIAALIATPAGSATPPGRPHVVELFTSQGCSSCPPADALLGELVDRSDIIALAFHVDYWNSLGWRDPFSMAEVTKRQRDYVEALNLPTAFTPQIVVDGQVSFVGSDRRRVASVLRPFDPTADSVQIEMRVANAQLLIALPEAKQCEQCTLTLVAYLPKAATAIPRGENSGRTLVEYNVVRQVRRLGAWSGSRGEYKIPLSSLPADATHVAILLQRNGQAIAGAATLAVH